MTDFVRRTCTEFREDGQVMENADRSKRTLLPFAEFRDTDAYVLLGPPGAGKSTTFKQEAACSKACYVTARDFIELDVDRHPEWHNTTLFIDGLDEKRAGSPDGRQALEGIRKKIEQLNRPRFRLSCREADWFGANDREHLKTVSLNGQVTVLHLDPLTDDDILKILRDKLKADDPDKFVREAHQKGLKTLLANPQNLSMLVKAVAGGDWPETRLQMFEMACRTLFREHNQEHQVAKTHRVPISHLLDAAGRLCAVQLLIGCAGYALPGTESDHECLGLEQISGEDQKVLRHVLGTKLFTAPSEGRATPVHRHVAEFLAGRYLAGLIENGLPVRRILALMTGDDGGVVSELRGLSAWLAAHSKISRTAITERDPIGTVLYGDVKDFSFDEKRRLIENLKQDAQTNQEFFQVLAKMDPRFGDLATPDMEPVFREVLTSPSRDDTHQALVMILIEALRHGLAAPELTDVVLDVVRDDSWKQGIRHRALDTILLQSKNNQQTGDKLMALLADVYDGSVPDPDDELLGQLLQGLYPSKLSASEICRYLRTPKNEIPAGMHELFWNGYVVKKSTNAQCAELLDTLVARHKKMSAEIREDLQPDIPFSSLPSDLLVRFLKTSQEDIAPDQLFDWLGLAALDPPDLLPFDDEPAIDDWLSKHPRIQKSIIAKCIECCNGKQPFGSFSTCVDMKRSRLFNATPPPDFGSWCLEQAIRATDDNAAIWYIIQVAGALYNHQHDEGLTRKIVDERLADHPSLEQAFRERLSKWEESKNREDTLRENSKKKKSKKQQEFRDHVKKNVAALRENRCPPALLDQLAGAYFGELRGVAGDNPRDRLHNLLGDDTALIETVLTALRDSVKRSDLPTDTEIIRLRGGSQRYFLELPFLAGLELSEPERETSLNERQMRQAIAFYYTSVALRYYRGDKPHWYRWLLAHHPEVVSEVLIEFVRSELRNGREHFPEAPKLAFSKEHQAVARLASLTLLELFPVRCTSRQLGLLNVLLIAALFHCEKEAFEKLIEHKLSFSSMNVAQRIYWLAAGFFASPAAYRETFEKWVSEHEQRIRHLAEFLTAYRDQSAWSKLFDRLDVQELKLLIRLLGGSFRPISYSRQVMSYDGTQMMTTDLVTGLINRLASLPSRDATLALESLSSDKALHPWQFKLVDSASRQNAIRREASFRHKDVDRILQVLDNLKPANAADLAALTMDILSDMAKRIRDGNTLDWRQYWNVDSHNRAQDPKPENACRDALLSDLRLKLERVEVHVKINAQREDSYADDKRADISVTHGDFNVPVEIKKSTHRDLWRAIQEQLIAQYTRDPGAAGYGIFLVFWFGGQDCQISPEGIRPKSAHELQERLLDTLSPDEKFKISICVIDVSKPL